VANPAPSLDGAQIFVAELLHGVYSLTATAPVAGFGVAYRRAGADDPAEVGLPTHLADLAELRCSLSPGITSVRSESGAAHACLRT